MNMTTIHNIQHTHALGAYGEFIARNFLEEHGYNVQSPDGTKHGDLIATGDDGQALKIEVKTARESSRGRWDYQLFKSDRHGSTNHLNSDIVLLLAVTKATIFYYVIPSRKLRKKSKIAITSHPLSYTGQLAQYRVKSNEFSLNGQVH